MTRFKTKRNERDTYIYRDAYGRIAAELHPGEDDVTEEHIADLHRYDDVEHNAMKRGICRGLYHYDQASGDADDIPHDRQLDLADYAADPETQFLAELRNAEIRATWYGLQPQQRTVVLRILRGRTKVDIAKEEGVSEAAIRNRLAKIQKIFQIFLN